MVLPNMIAVHTDPKHWGDDAHVFRPSRWIVPAPELSKDAIASDASFDPFPGETILETRRGTYFPWSDGSRNCLGKSFSQVEFVAVLAVLFRSNYVHIVTRPNETKQMARARFLETLQQHSFGITLMIKDPESMMVSWALQSDLSLDDA
jgi:cytochrome P450